MYLSFTTTAHRSLISSRFPHSNIDRICSCSNPNSSKLKNPSVNQGKFRPVRSVSSDNDNQYGSSYEAQSCSTNDEGSMEKSKSTQRESFSAKEVLIKLRKYGISGILSYGLLNTAYYLTTFLVVWFYVAPAPRNMGYAAAVTRFLKIMAMVWTGSQVTKLVRAGGALALAPIVDRGLSWFTIRFKFETQAKAFVAIVGLCFGLAAVVFLIVTLLCA